MQDAATDSSLLPPNIERYAAEFLRDGFVVVPDLLSAEELERYGRSTDEAVARRKRHDTRAVQQKSLYEQSFIQCMNLWEDSPGVLPLTFHRRVGATAAALLGVEALRLWHDQALYKEPGGRITDPHQDQPYWPMRETDTITAWIPFDGSTVESGCMGYIAGSHVVGLRKFVNIFQPEKAQDILSEPAIKDVAPTWMEVPRGAVAFHHGLTVHLAKPNRTGGVRRVHTMIYFRDGTTRGRDFPHPSVDRAGIKVGDVIASDLTPIVWPRAEGDLPAPPDLPFPELFKAYLSTGTFPMKDKA